MGLFWDVNSVRSRFPLLLSGKKDRERCSAERIRNVDGVLLLADRRGKRSCFAAIALFGQSCLDDMSGILDLLGRTPDDDFDSFLRR